MFNKLLVISSNCSRFALIVAFRQCGQPFQVYETTIWFMKIAIMCIVVLISNLLNTGPQNTKIT